MVLVYSQQFSRLTQPLGDGATDEAGKPSRIKQFLKTAIMLFVEQRINFVNEDVQVFDSSEKSRGVNPYGRADGSSDSSTVPAESTVTLSMNLGNTMPVSGMNPFNLPCAR